MIVFVSKGSLQISVLYNVKGGLLVRADYCKGYHMPLAGIKIYQVLGLKSQIYRDCYNTFKLL